MRSATAVPAREQPTSRIALQLLAIVVGLTLVRLAFLAAEPYPLDPDEAQYWSYGEALAAGYYSKPPLTAWLIAASTSLFGDTAFGVRFASPVLHALIAMLLFLSGRRLFNPTVGFWSALAWLTLPGVSVSAGLMTTDPPMLLCWAAALYLLILLIERPTLIRWAGFGGVIGLGLLAKYTMIAFPLSLALFLLFNPRERARFSLAGGAVALGAALVVVAPNLAWNAQHEFATLRHVGDNASLGGDLLRPDRLAEFVGAQFGVFGPVLFGVLLVVLTRWRRLGAEPRWSLLLWMAATLLAIITLQSLLSRAHANWAAPSYLAGAILVSAWLLQSGRLGWLKAGVGINLAFALAWPAYLMLIALQAPAWPSSLDPLAKARAAPELGAEIQAIRAAWPGEPPQVLFDHRRLMATSLFYGGLDLTDTYMWTAGAEPGNHYALVRDLEADPPAGPLLYVTGQADPASVMAVFQHAEPLGEIEIATHPDRRFQYFFFRLDGFRGYPG
jgi:4-amino-4-deoxy-L-arabinose transferase-like glycosyltransferase